MYACNRWLYYPHKTPHSENLLKPVRTLQNLTYLIKPQFNYLYATQMTAVCLNTLVNLCNKFNQLFNMKHLFVICYQVNYRADVINSLVVDKPLRELDSTITRISPHSSLTKISL